MSADGTVRHSIHLSDTRSGWSFTLHSEDRRVWLVANPTETPVSLAFMFGHHAHEIEVLVGRCVGPPEMVALTRGLLPDEVVVSTDHEILDAAA